jgi:hypothetical protein
MGASAFAAERDRLLAPRGQWRNGRGVGERAQGVWNGGNGNGGVRQAAVPVEAPAPVAVAVAEPLADVAPIEPAEEPPAPADAVPLQAAPAGASASVNVSIGEDVPVEQLLGAIESVKGALAGRPGPLPVVLSISVAGASRQVRLPDRVAWDDRLAEHIRGAAGVPVSVELRPAVEERIA